MTTKTFEVRDRLTFIPVMATRVDTRDQGDDYLLRRAGMPFNEAVLLTNLNDYKTCYSYNGQNNPTLKRAHQHIYEHWDTLESGQVIDVEFIRGETPEPKKSERLGQ